MFSGAVAGFVDNWVHAPIEHIRIRVQMQRNAKGTTAMYTGSYDCLRKVYKQYGIKGVYKG